MTPFRTIEALRKLDGAGVSELGAHLDIHKSTVHNHLSTLTQEEYVVNHDETYQLSLRFLEAGAYARNRRKYTTSPNPR